MSRIEMTATVTPDGRVTVDVPPDVHLPPGQHRVVIEVQDENVPAYDPAEVAAAFRAARGAFGGINTPQLLADIQAQRRQDSPGRPA